LRQAGLSYRQISAAMWADSTWATRLHKHYNARHVHADVMCELLHQRDELAEAVAVVRQQELDRLDHMLVGVWHRAQQGDDKAIQTVLHIMTRRARYIPGLEVPTALAPSPPTGHAPAPPAPVDSAEVAYQLAAYGLYQQQHGNGLVTEPGDAG
jgi:hypothetical protein